MKVFHLFFIIIFLIFIQSNSESYVRFQNDKNNHIKINEKNLETKNTKGSNWLYQAGEFIKEYTNIQGIRSIVGGILHLVKDTRENRINERFMDENCIKNLNKRDNQIAGKMALFASYKNTKLNIEKYNFMKGFQYVIHKENLLASRIDVIKNYHSRESFYSFRGTEKAEDWAINVLLKLRKDPYIPYGKVHFGLSVKVDEWWNDKEIMESIQYDIQMGHRILLTAHSQGAASSVIFAARLYELSKKLGKLPMIELILFAPMRAGDKTFAQEFVKRIPRITRVEATEDPVIYAYTDGFWSVGKKVPIHCKNSINWGAVTAVSCHFAKNMWLNYMTSGLFE